MGAWGPGNFQNDAALDWLNRCGDHNLAAMREALVAHDRRESANAGCRSLAAAELVAMRAGHPARKLPEVAATWLLDGVAPGASDITAALASVRELAGASGLQRLFDEDGRHDEWHAEVDDLIVRLEAALRAL